MTTEMRARIAKLKRRERALLQACEQTVLNSTLPKDQKVKINPILRGCDIPIQAFAMSVLKVLVDIKLVYVYNSFNYII